MNKMVTNKVDNYSTVWSAALNMVSKFCYPITTPLNKYTLKIAQLSII